MHDKRIMDQHQRADLILQADRQVVILRIEENAIVKAAHRVEMRFGDEKRGAAQHRHRHVPVRFAPDPAPVAAQAGGAPKKELPVMILEPRVEGAGLRIGAPRRHQPREAIGRQPGIGVQKQQIRGARGGGTGVAGPAKAVVDPGFNQRDAAACGESRGALAAGIIDQNDRGFSGHRGQHAGQDMITVVGNRNDGNLVWLHLSAPRMRRAIGPGLSPILSCAPCKVQRRRATRLVAVRGVAVRVVAGGKAGALPPSPDGDSPEVFLPRRKRRGLAAAVALGRVVR